MATMNISLPDDMKDWIDAQAKAQGFATNSEYVRAMIRERRAGIEHLKALVLEGINSGDPQPVGDTLARLRARIKTHSE